MWLRRERLYIMIRLGQRKRYRISRASGKLDAGHAV